MIKSALNSALNLYDEIDWIIIANKDGIIEYSTLYDPREKQFKNENTTGMHILEVYPGLKEEDSSILRVLKNGEPVFFEHQTLYDFRGNFRNIINSTVPIIEENRIIGAIEVSKFINSRESKVNAAERQNYSLKDIVTRDPKMLEIKEKIMRIAKTDSSVLIFGETGTGKELVAQSIHAQSRRNQMPFVSFNCAAVPENLLESILFGTMKGAFTGAENSQGIIAQANGGTLFLDELHTMSFSTQAKLLRFLEDRRIRRVGDHLEKSVDIRVISAINLPPMEAVEKKLIREDLFYRLSVVSIHIPPLRERPTDIPILTDYFIHDYNESMNRSIQGVSDLVMNLFREYAWKGNVRELRHTIEGAFNLAKGDVITLKDLPDYMVDVNASSGLVIPVSESISSISLEEKVREYEKSLICRALAENESYAEAARRLGITRQSLRYKIEKFDLHK